MPEAQGPFVSLANRLANPYLKHHAGGCPSGSTKLKFVVASKAQWSPANSRIRVKVKNPVTAKFGCDRCAIQFSSDSGGKVLVKGIAHWTWSNGYLYFFPADGVTPNTFNAVFSSGDALTVSNRDRGRPYKDNLALSVVYGINHKDRIRVGTTSGARDFTVFTVNALGQHVKPGGTLSTRQYFATGDYLGMHSRIERFIEQATTRLKKPHRVKGEKVFLFAGDGDEQFGAGLKSGSCDATPRCVGSTAPNSGLVPLFAIQCGP